MKNETSSSSVLGVWLFTIPSKLGDITNEEREWVNKLSPRKSWLYHFSRSSARHAISNLTGIPPLNIPLQAEPGKPPLLANGWGHISFSHCKDALIIGWSSERIGVDIERSDREFKADKLANRYFSNEEKEEVKGLKKDAIRSEVLDRWVTKEAAIKWQRGKIASNLNQWHWQKKLSLMSHKSLKHEINIYKSTYNQWTFALAYDKRIYQWDPILCIH